MGPQEWTLIGLAVVGYTISFGAWMSAMHANVKVIRRTLEEGDAKFLAHEKRLDKHDDRLAAHDLKFAQITRKPA